jgi:ribosome biogenesis GTPase
VVWPPWKAALDPGRYESYLKLERELAHLARQQDRRLKMQEVRRWKQITMDWRRRKKIEGR